MEILSAKYLVLAAGAYEYVPPFPGWTLPGVMTPGAAQVLIKSARVLPGKKTLVVGTGPFLLAVATTLLDAGAEVCGVVEAATRWETIKLLPQLCSSPSLLAQGWRYLRKLRKARVPIHAGHVIVRAEGNRQLQRVQFAPCDVNWRPDLSRTRSIEVDTLCVGYGFVPRTELAQLAECNMKWSNEVGGWHPQVDQDMMTSQPRVWVAGDGAGVAGAVVAADQGELVGLAVARETAKLTDEAFRTRAQVIRNRLGRLAKFRLALDNISAVRAGLTELAEDETLVCRCEKVPLRRVESALDAGCGTCRTIKMATRCGMGPCQGRMCWPSLYRMIQSRTGTRCENAIPMSIRAPIMPITIRELAEANLP